MGDSVDGTLQPPSIGNTSMTWNPSFVASGDSQLQSPLVTNPQVLLQTSEREMPLQDVIVTVEMSSEQEHMSDCFGSKFDEYTIHANQNGEEEDTARDECISQYSSLPDSAIVARRGTKRKARNHHAWSEDDMTKAIAAVASGKYSGYTAAMKYSVPKSTLQNRLRKGNFSKKLQLFESPESGTDIGGKVANSGKRGTGNELPIFPKDVTTIKTEGTTGSVASGSLSNKVDVMARSKGRQHRWTEEDMASALICVESKEMPPKMAALHHGIPFWALRDRLRAKINKEGGMTGKRSKKMRAKWTKWSEGDVERAIIAIKEQGFSIRKAASFYGIPKSSLCDRLHGKRKGSRPEEEQIDVSLEDLDKTHRQIIPDVAADKELISGKNMLRCRIKHGKISRKNLTTTNSCNEGFRRRLGDEVQVHIIEEDTVVDGTYDQNFPIKDKRNFEDRRIPSEEQYEDEKDLSEYNFDHEGTMTYTNEEIADQDDIRIDVKRVPNAPIRTNHLRGRITMTDEVIDRKEIQNTSAKSWTHREMEDAIRDVTANGFSIRQAANKHCIPKSSLADRISKEKCMRVVGKLVEELKPLAKTDEDMQRLQKLEDGKLNPKTVAKRFGMTYTCLRKFIAGEEEAAMCFSGLQGDSEVGVLHDEIDRNGDLMQPSFNKLSHNLHSSDTGDNLQARIDSKTRRARLRWKRDNLEQAIAAVREGRLSLRGSSKMYGIPKSTLGDILRGKSSVGSSSKGNLLLSESEEASIAGWLITMAKAGRRVKVKEVLETVKAILDKSGRTVPRLNDNLPKDSWWYGFLARHKEVAEVRRQSKFGTGKDMEDIDVCMKQNAGSNSTEFVPDKVTVLPAEEQYFVINDTPGFLHSKIALDPDKDGDGNENCLCSICGTESFTENAMEQWISCGAMNKNGTQTEGCGGWSHLNCTNLVQRNLTNEELRNISWRCPKCMEQ